MDDSFDELNITCDMGPDSLSDLINYNEKNNIKEKLKNEEWKTKFYELEKLKGDLLSSDYLTSENFQLLKTHAVSKGGFLTNDIRRIFWRKILCVEMTKGNNQYEFMFAKDSNSNSNESEFLEMKEPYDISNIR